MSEVEEYKDILNQDETEIRYKDLLRKYVYTKVDDEELREKIMVYISGRFHDFLRFCPENEEFQIKLCTFAEQTCSYFQTEDDRQFLEIMSGLSGADETDFSWRQDVSRKAVVISTDEEHYAGLLREYINLRVDDVDMRKKIRDYILGRFPSFCDCCGRDEKFQLRLCMFTDQVCQYFLTEDERKFRIIMSETAQRNSDMTWNLAPLGPVPAPVPLPTAASFAQSPAVSTGTPADFRGNSQSGMAGHHRGDSQTGFPADFRGGSQTGRSADFRVNSQPGRPGDFRKSPPFGNSTQEGIQEGAVPSAGNSATAEEEKPSTRRNIFSKRKPKKRKSPEANTTPQNQPAADALSESSQSVAENAEAESEENPITRTLETAGIIICLILMIWMAIGLLMALDIIPMIDLGYTWFNEHILSIF